MRTRGRLMSLMTIIGVVLGCCLILAPVVLAAPGGRVLAVNDLPTTIRNITRLVVGMLATIATCFLTLGGLRYLMAGGDPGQVEKAKSALKSAAVGYALALLAPVLVALLKQVVGA